MTNELRIKVARSDQFAAIMRQKIQGGNLVIDSQDLQTVEFDYTGLDGETAEFIQARTAEIRNRLNRTTQDIIDVGEQLTLVKNRLDHGQFGKWLTVEFAWSDRTARNFMSAYERFKSETVSDLALEATALYKLAAPSTPDAAVAEALARARDGEVISKMAAEDLIKKHRPKQVSQSPANIGQNQRLNLAEDVGPYRVMTSGPLTRYGTEEDASEPQYKGIWKKHTDAGGWREVEKFWFIGRDAAKTWHEEKVALLQRLIEEGKLPNESSFDTHREKNVATIDLYGDPALSEAVNQGRISPETAAYLIENHSPHIAAVVAGNMLPFEARLEIFLAQRRAVPASQPAPTGHVDDAKRPGVSSALTEEEPEEDKSEKPQIVPLSFPDGLADKPWQTRYLTLSAQMDEDSSAVLLARAGLYWVALGIQAVRLEGVLAAHWAGETFKHSFVDGPEDTKVAIVLPERGDRWQYDLMMTYDLHWYPETDEVAAFCELMTGGAPEAPVLTVVEPSAPDLSGPVERYLATVIEMYAQLDVLAAECLEECATDAEQAQITFHQDGRSLQSIRTMLEDHLYALDRMSARLADEAVVPKDNRRVHNLMQEIGGFLWTVHKERQANAERDSEAAR